MPTLSLNDHSSGKCQTIKLAKCSREPAIQLMNRLERPQNFPAKAQKLSNATTSLYRWRHWDRIIPIVNTHPVPNRRFAQDHSKPATDPELNVIPTFPTVHLFWLLVDLKMKPSVIRSSSSRSGPGCPEEEPRQRQQQVKSNHILSFCLSA